MVFFRSTFRHPAVRSVAMTVRFQQRRPMSFFSNLKKQFEEELSKNKDLQKNLDKVGADLEKARERAAKVAQQTADATKEAAKKTADVTKDSAGKASEWVEKAGSRSGATEKLKEAARKAQDAAEAAGDRTGVKSAEDAKETLKGFRGIIDRTFGSFRKEAETTKEKIAKQASEASFVKETRAQFSKARDGVNQSPVFQRVYQQIESIKQSGVTDGWGDAYNELLGRKEKGRGGRVKVHRSAAQKAKEAMDEMRGEDETEEEMKKRMAEEKASEWDDDEEKEIIGDGALRVVAQEKGAWEKISERLSSTPLISDILRQGGKAAEAAKKTKAAEAARRAGTAANEFAEDVREHWETSQNPWVYRASAAYDAVFAETETAQAVREVQRLDPDFNEHIFMEELRDEVLPHVISCFLKGDNDNLREILSEGAYAMVYAAMKQRKADGLVMDTNILSLKTPELMAAQLVDKQPPIFVCGTLAQQINCIKNKEGKIVEGAEDEIRGVYYVVAMQREFDEKNSELIWRVQELQVQVLDQMW
eukprot:g2622.t1